MFMNFAVFGLGNKTYEHFNVVGTYVDAALAKLGGTRLLEAGVGDDDGNLEDDFLGWKERCGARRFWLRSSSSTRPFSIGPQRSQGDFPVAEEAKPRIAMFDNFSSRVWYEVTVDTQTNEDLFISFINVK